MSSIDDRLLGDLLALERDYDELPPGAEARMLGAIATALDGGGGGDDGGDSDGGGGGGGGGDGGAGGSVGAGVGAGGSAGTAMGTSASAMTWLARAAWLGAGVVAGASGHAVIADKPAPLPPVASVAFVAPAPPASVTTPTASATTIAIDDLPSARPTAIATATAPKSSARIGEERSDLDVARAALARGRVDACLEAIDRHARTYGEGHFAEEREVLAVQALVAAGRRDEALARASRFRAKYPNSLFNPALQKATEKKEPSP